MFASPVGIQWTPAPDLLNVTQSVLRAPGPCTSPPSGGQYRMTFGDTTTSSYSDPAPDGTYCYYIQAADLLTPAYSPGLTVVVDTLPPVAAVAVSGQSATGVVSGTVSVSGTAADAGAGVASSVLHVGATGACAAGPVVGAQWDTTSVANGSYDVCNVVTDNAGHTATATATVRSCPTVRRPLRRTSCPSRPRSSRSHARAPRSTVANVTLTLRWVNPAAANLASVLVVLNLDHATEEASATAPRSIAGSDTSTSVSCARVRPAVWRCTRTPRAAPRSPAPARTKVSLASLIPLRPLTGSVLHKVPVLTWKPKKGSAYYNLQLYRNGKRVLVVWPSQASYRMPASVLKPGTYVWYVWPALRVGGTAKFASLIGRATFVYRA